MFYIKKKQQNTLSGLYLIPTRVCFCDLTMFLIFFNIHKQKLRKKKECFKNKNNKIFSLACISDCICFCGLTMFLNFKFFKLIFFPYRLVLKINFKK